MWHPQCVDNINTIQSGTVENICHQLGYSDLLNFKFNREIQFEVTPNVFTSVVLNNNYKNLILKRNDKTIMRQSKTNETCFTVSVTCY